MNISVTPVSFEGRSHYLSSDSHKKVKDILTRMNSETLYKEQGDMFDSTILESLTIKDEAQFVDNRHLVRPSSHLDGNSELSFKKINIRFDNKTGEIVKYKKPFFSTWNGILKKADNYIKLAHSNYDNSSVVKKNRVTISGLTRSGIIKVKAAFDNAFKTFK